MSKTTVDLSIATRPSDADAVPELIKDLDALNGNWKGEDEETRLQMVVKARSLLQSLLTPREQMLQHTWADVSGRASPFFQATMLTQERTQPGLDAALITGVDVGLWKLMVKNGVDTVHKVDDLAKSLGMDPELLG